MADTSTPAAVLKGAACYDGIPPGNRDAVMIFLLEQVAKTGLTPAQMAKAASCYCFDKKASKAVIAMLLDKLANP